MRISYLNLIMFAKIFKSFKFSTVHIALVLISIQYCSSVPVKTVENIYTKFISDMNSNKCATPEQMKLPVNISAAENFEYMSSYMKVCQNLDTIERSKEAEYLCSEIFDNLKVILCPPISAKVFTQFSNLTLSKQVCKDIGSMKDIPNEKAILKRLTDGLSCEIMCDNVFEKACQVLLWSYEAQKQNEKLGNEDKVENPSQLEIKPDTGKTKIQEATVTPQETAETTHALEVQTKEKLKQPSVFVLGPQMVEEQPIQNQAAKTQPIDLPSNTNNPGTTAQNASSNNIVPIYRDNEVRNNSLNIAPKVPQVEMNGNDLPENKIEHQGAGVDEIQEDPHDNEDPLHHTVEAAISDTKVELPQSPSEKSHTLPTNKSLHLAANNELPHLSDNDESPHLPDNEKPMQPPANVDLVDPHDDEELGEAEIEPKVPLPSDKANPQDNKIENPNLNNEANVQIEQKITTAQKGATTKEASSLGSTKNSATTKVEVEEKPGEEVSKITIGQKTTENPSSLPSQKESSISSVVSPSSEDLVPTTVTLEKMEGEDDVHENPEDREPDQYTDLENTEEDPDDVYARQEYDGGLYEHAKNKETVLDKPNKEEVPKMDVPEQTEQTFNEFASKNKYGRQPEIPIMAVFPEQEDSHFFFYFLSIVLILMAGYLIFHNKQKIIALIVEGRHERRRRSHGVGYKKLETK